MGRRDQRRRSQPQRLCRRLVAVLGRREVRGGRCGGLPQPSRQGARRLRLQPELSRVPLGLLSPPLPLRSVVRRPGPRRRGCRRGGAGRGAAQRARGRDAQAWAHHAEASKDERRSTARLSARLSARSWGSEGCVRTSGAEHGESGPPRPGEEAPRVHGGRSTDPRGRRFYLAKLASRRRRRTLVLHLQYCSAAPLPCSPSCMAADLTCRQNE